MSIDYRGAYRPRVHEESPWYWPIAPWLERFSPLARFPSPAELSALEREHSEATGLAPLTFVTSTKGKKRKGRGRPIALAELYEGRIVERGEVPTRADDWHDLFNALAFLAFPRSKRALHARQYGLLRARLSPGAKRLPNARTREQDALALFDEGGLCVAAVPAALAQVTAALEEPDEGALCALLAEGVACVVPFGHALYEHLAAGFPCPLGTAHVLPLAPPVPGVEATWLDQLDRALADALTDPAVFRAPSRARGSSLTALSAGCERAVVRR